MGENLLEGQSDGHQVHQAPHGSSSGRRLVTCSPVPPAHARTATIRVDRTRKLGLREARSWASVRARGLEPDALDTKAQVARSVPQKASGDPQSRARKVNLTSLEFLQSDHGLQIIWAALRDNVLCRC